jgi:tetratricopeptide (TPR) repeat protein
MARPLFEQYKDALRRGHLALLGDELDAALEAYREASALVADRPLPYASMGAVLERLGRAEEALAAYDKAVALAPGEAMYSEPRESIAASLRSAQALTEASGSHLDPPPRPDPGSATDPPAAADEVTGDAVASAAAAPVIEPDNPAAATWPAIDLPSLPPPPLVGPPPDPAALQAEADGLVDGGDPAAARDLLLLAVAVHRDAGRLDAAIDSCLQLLALRPGDPRVHLAIANLQLDRGWRSVATEKIELLLRLTSLSGDAQAEADVHLLAADRLRDESPARLDARKRGIATP